MEPRRVALTTSRSPFRSVCTERIISTALPRVGDVYKRAALTHCTRKAVIRMKWAQFEETIGGVEEAREILRQLVEKYPMLLEARMQQIDLERRQKKYEVAEQLYQTHEADS